MNAGRTALRPAWGSAALGLRSSPTASLIQQRPASRPSPLATQVRGASDGGTKPPRKGGPESNNRNDGSGSLAQTDKSLRHAYPSPQELPPSAPVEGAGRAGLQVLPTLASFSLEGKVGIVTGGARGLGLVMGQGMVVSGADLAIVDLNVNEAKKQAAAIVETFKKDHPEAKRVPKVTAHYADVADPGSVDSCLAEVLAAHGRVDNLVTSAGFTENFEATAYPVDRMRKLWGVNVDGTYLFATAVARHLMQRGAKGSMVLIGSMSGAIVNVPQPQT